MSIGQYIFLGLVVGFFILVIGTVVMELYKSIPEREKAMQDFCVRNGYTQHITDGGDYCYNANTREVKQFIGVDCDYWNGVCEYVFIREND